MVCPAGVKIAEINARARRSLVTNGKYPLRLRLRNNLIARSELLGKIGSPLAVLANPLLKSPQMRWVLEKTLSIDRRATLPAFAKERFSAWFLQRKNRLRSSRKVAYFHGCSTEYYEPRIGQAVVHVLERNGFEVVLPSQNCCGLPLLSNGEFAAARSYHSNNVRSLVKMTQQGIPIVGSSTSCTLTLKEEAAELLELHSQEIESVAASTFDLNEFLLALYQRGELNLDFSPIQLNIPYHVPCQYRAHRLGKIGLDVLSLIPGLEIDPLDADCCGIAGTYGYKSEKYEIAMQVGLSLFNMLEKNNTRAVICDSETCRWQITHATQLPAIHPIELLAAGYGLFQDGPLRNLIETKKR